MYMFEGTCVWVNVNVFVDQMSDMYQMLSSLILIGIRDKEVSCSVKWNEEICKEKYESENHHDK